jgi:benzoyl-CoA reductase/2-hydroxyglutaryl-CoA dehydratase subunit BcrC/BadD/HgdB
MTLPTLQRIADAVAARPAELAALREEGTLVAGYFCCNIPEELVLAAGLVPVRLGRGGDDGLVEVGGRYISHQNCPFVRQNVGAFATEAAVGSPDPWVANTDVVLAAATCPQMSRLAEVIEHFFHRRAEVLGVPRNFTSDNGHAYFRAEVADLATRLAKITGNAITPGRLGETVALLAGIRTSIKALYRAQAERPDVLSWRQAFETVQAGFYLDRWRYAALLEDLLAEAQAAASSPAAVGEDGRVKLFVSGTVIAPGDTKIVDLIEGLGARVVGDDLCTGLRPFLRLEVAGPSIDAVADAYLDRVQCAALPHLSLGDDRRLANIEESYEATGAEGVLYHSLRYCDPFAFKANGTKRFLGKGVPFLEIHTEYATSDTEGIRTRISAFIEMIEAARTGKEDQHVA